MDEIKLRITLLRATIGLLVLSANVAAGFARDTVTLAGNHPLAAEHVRSAPDADPARSLTMEISFALNHRVELDQLLAGQQDPSSPNYHKWLETGEFDRRFGPRRNDVRSGRGLARE